MNAENTLEYKVAFRIQNLMRDPSNARLANPSHRDNSVQGALEAIVRFVEQQSRLKSS